MNMMKWVSDPNLARITIWLAITDFFFERMQMKSLVWCKFTVTPVCEEWGYSSPVLIHKIIVLLRLSKALTITLYTSWLWSEQGIAKHLVNSATFHHRRYAKFA